MNTTFVLLPVRQTAISASYYGQILLFSARRILSESTVILQH